MRVRTDVVRGRPVRVGNLRLSPVVRRTVAGGQRATVGRGVSGRGGVFVRLRPIGVAVAGEEEQVLPIPDRTRRVLNRFLAVGVLVMLLSLLVGWMAGRPSEED